MTGSAFATYVKNKFKRDDKDTELYEAATDTIALMRLEFQSDEYSEEATVAGISTVGEYRIAVPVDFGHIIGKIGIKDTADDQNYNPLVKISKQRYDEIYSDRVLDTVANVHTDVPRHFSIYAGQIYLGPVPDKTTYEYQINYTTEDSSDITSATDPVPFTEELRYRNILRNGVLFELHDGMENFDEAAYYKQLFNDGLARIIRSEDDNKAAQSNIIYNGF
jgi:hypothetical protein